jgi:hypothetical protein
LDSEAGLGDDSQNAAQSKFCRRATLDWVLSGMRTGHPFAFWWLFLESLDFLTLPVVGVAVAALSVSTVWSLIVRNPFRRGTWRCHYWFLLTQLLFFPVTVCVGYWFAVEPLAHISQPVSVASRVIDILFYASLILGCFWVYRMKNLRWFAASFCLLQQVCLFGAAMVAGMAVTGDWL